MKFSCSSLACLFVQSYIYVSNYEYVVLQRFYMVKPCPKEMKCDVEVTSNFTHLSTVEKHANNVSPLSHSETCTVVVKLKY
jgi:hypothetical protein